MTAHKSHREVQISMAFVYSLQGVLIKIHLDFSHLLV